MLLHKGKQREWNAWPNVSHNLCNEGGPLSPPPPSPSSPLDHRLLLSALNHMFTCHCTRYNYERRISWNTLGKNITRLKGVQRIHDDSQISRCIYNNILCYLKLIYNSNNYIMKNKLKVIIYYREQNSSIIVIISIRLIIIFTAVSFARCNMCKKKSGVERIEHLLRRICRLTRIIELRMCIDAVRNWFVLLLRRPPNLAVVCPRCFMQIAR